MISQKKKRNLVQRSLNQDILSRFETRHNERCENGRGASRKNNNNNNNKRANSIKKQKLRKKKQTSRQNNPLFFFFFCLRVLIITEHD